MSQEGAYMVYCLERYRYARHLSGAAVAELFRRYGLFAYVMKYFGALHTMPEELVLEAIDHHIARAH